MFQRLALTVSVLTLIAVATAQAAPNVDGKQFQIRATIQPTVRDGGEATIVGVLRNLTKQNLRNVQLYVLVWWDSDPHTKRWVRIDKSDLSFPGKYGPNVSAGVIKPGRRRFYVKVPVWRRGPYEIAQSYCAQVQADHDLGTLSSFWEVDSNVSCADYVVTRK